MKEKRTFAGLPALVAALALALLLMIGTYTVIASQVPSAGPDPGLADVSVSAAAWDNWVTVPTGTCRLFSHGLGGNPEDYIVEMWFLDTDGDLGLNRRYYGRLEDNGNWYGAHWQDLTGSTVRVCRGQQDNVADRIHLRISIAPTSPDYDSSWTNIGPGQTATFTHGLSITATDLTVNLWFSGTVRGIHHLGYGGLAIDTLQRMEGAHWHDLTDTTVQVTRHPSDTNINQVRVIVVHGDTPAYDSLVDLGDWQDVSRGAIYTFTHSLSWDPNLLLVRGECYSTTGGIHQWLAGGNHDWFIGWQGANIQNLTSNTVQIYRQPNDDVCPQARLRIWRRRALIYLPLVVNNHLSEE